MSDLEFSTSCLWTDISSTGFNYKIYGVSWYEQDITIVSLHKTFFLSTYARGKNETGPKYTFLSVLSPWGVVGCRLPLSSLDERKLGWWHREGGDAHGALLSSLLCGAISEQSVDMWLCACVVLHVVGVCLNEFILNFVKTRLVFSRHLPSPVSFTLTMRCNKPIFSCKNPWSSSGLLGKPSDRWRFPAVNMVENPKLARKRDPGGRYRPAWDGRWAGAKGGTPREKRVDRRKAKQRRQAEIDGSHGWLEW
jgi:hypothetical protein